ncbi:peptidoglycan-binding protein [Candidatus Parcubacteria bacterium]|nr:peptidoglycan-binding protein [Candidatus Parcubacteria bacterium]
MKAIRTNIPKRMTTILMAIVVICTSIPFSAFAALSVDLKANGQDSLTLANSTSSFDITLNQTDAVSCQITGPGGLSSGFAIGSTMTIAPGSPSYPAAGGSSTFTIGCLDAGGASLTDSVTVNAPAAPAAAPTIDLKANGSDGPVTVTSGSAYTYTWTSSNATACQTSSPVTSGVTLAGSGTVNPGDPFYPAVGSPVTITITCTNGSQNATDSVVINLSPGGGGGGSTPTIDVKANGQDGTVTVTSGSSYTYTWVSGNATACQMSSPVTSGVSLSGSGVVNPGDPFYPSIGNPVTITITCTDGTQNATDSVIVQLTPGGGGGGSPTVDVKANGSDGPVVLQVGQTYVYTWVSGNATACQMSSPVTSGVALSGTSVTIDSSNTAFYPTLSAPVTITITCTNGSQNATDSVVIQLVNNGGGGGGGGGGGSSSSSGRGSVLPGAISAECPWIHDYMRIDFNNDPIEVAKLQAFLKVFMGYDYVTVNGVFDQATWTAVGAFQMAYRDEILTPWGHTAPTHYVYILTLKKVNEIFCQQIIPLTPDQQNEIVAFRNLINIGPARSSGQSGFYSKEGFISKEGYISGDGSGLGTASSTTTVIPQTSTTTVPVEVPITGNKGQISTGLAAALFTFPDNLKDNMLCLFEFALILIVLYILGSVLKDVLYSDLPENAVKRFLAKWITISLGLLLTLIGAYLLKEFCLLLPTLIALVASLLWMSFYPKHDSMRSTTKSWTTWNKGPAGATVVDKKEERKAA